MSQARKGATDVAFAIVGECRIRVMVRGPVQEGYHASITGDVRGSVV